MRKNLLLYRFLPSAVLLLVAAGQLALAQQPAAQQPAPPAQQSARPPAQQSEEDQKPTETLKVNVNVVQLFFNVKDKHGALIPNLTKNDFEIAEDSKPQTIKYFTAESNLPLTLGMMIDASGSQRNVIDMEKEVGAAFLKQILTDKDEAFVISFDITVDLLQDFTRDTHRLQAALNKAKVNVDYSSGGIPGMGGGPVPQRGNSPGTLLYDAVYLSAHDMLSKEVGRKAMILLTDGQDEGSRLKIQDAIEAAQKADTIVYVLLCADRGFYGGFGGYSGEGEMRKLTEQTGGRVINVGNKFDKLREAFDQIAAELRSQYNIGYTPTNAKKDGTYRKIEIKDKQGYKIQARSGYYAGKEAD
ncbi:MAG TPA: VWA domain-containing protein [Candidatus Sulfotelmatobacter sp.]|nr:VWA domain-containing protein [Candidatus Sulfotelmatobacter sp.]